MEAGKFNLLHEKTKAKYQKVYEDFMAWRTKMEDPPIEDSTILQYLVYFCSGKAPATAWSTYSMLRSSLLGISGINISGFADTLAYLKKNSEGMYRSRNPKSKCLTEEEIERFLTTAPDSVYLACKVVLIMGICGGLSREELYRLTLSDMDKRDSILLVRSIGSRSKRERMFAVTGEYFKLYQKYAKLRPKNPGTDHFFMKYSNGKCARQVIGVNKIGQVPRDVACFLGLPEAKNYNSYSFRHAKTSALCKAVGSMKNLSSGKNRVRTPRKSRTEFDTSSQMNRSFDSSSTDDYISDYKVETILGVEDNPLDSEMGENSNSRMSDDFNPLTPAFVSINEDCAFVNPLTRDDLKDHIPEITKCTYHMSRLCAACKWSVRLYYSGEDQPQEIRATNGQNGSTPGQLLDSPYNLVHTMNQDQQIVFVNTNTAPQVYTPTKSAGDGRYLEPGPHFSPTFTAGTNKELKWEIRLDHKDGDFYARLNFLELKGSLRYDYKISYLKKNLQEQIIRDFSNVYSNDSSTKDVQLPRGLQLRFAKSTLVLIVCIVTETDHLSSDPIKTEMDDEDNDDIVSVDGEVSEAAQELEVMYEKGLLTDVTLHVEGQSIAAHKYILAARSRVFLEMFTNGEQEVNPEIEIEDLTYFSAREMMKFFYTGHLRDVEEEVARQLMITANKYGIKLLFSKCETILADCLNVDNVVDLFKLADSSNAEELKLKAKEFLIKNIKSVPGDMLSTLNSNFLTEILLEVTKRQN